jgi:hypothetical protein
MGHHLVWTDNQFDFGAGRWVAGPTQTARAFAMSGRPALWRSFGPRPHSEERGSTEAGESIRASE